MPTLVISFDFVVCVARRGYYSIQQLEPAAVQHQRVIVPTEVSTDIGMPKDRATAIT